MSKYLFIFMIASCAFCLPRYSLGADNIQASPPDQPPEEAESDSFDDEVKDPDARVEPGSGRSNLDLSEDDELQLTQGEILDELSFGLALGEGVSAPWQMHLAALSFKLEQQWMFSSSLGGGAFVTEGTDKGRDYEITVNSQSLIAGLRWFPLASAPLFIEPLLGLGLWEGSMKPQGNDSISDNETSRLTAGLDAAGLIFGANLGLMWLWPNGFFVEYSFQRVGYAKILSHHFTNATPQSENLIVRGIERPQSWGFANIRIGYFL